MRGQLAGSHGNISARSDIYSLLGAVFVLFLATIGVSGAEQANTESTSELPIPDQLQIIEANYKRDPQTALKQLEAIHQDPRLADSSLLLRCTAGLLKGNSLFIINEYRSAMSQYESLLAVCESLQGSYIPAEIYHWQGRIYDELGNPESAFTAFRKAYPQLSAWPDQRFFFSLLLDIGLLASKELNWEEATTAFNEALVVAKRIGEKRAIAYAYTNLGYLKIELSQYDKAAEYITEALNLKNEKDDPNGVISDLYNLALTYTAAGDHESALRYQQRSFELAKKNQFHWRTARALRSLGDTYVKLKAYQEAEAHYKESIAIAEAKQLDRQLSLGNKYLALLYFELERYTEAEQSASKSLEVAMALNMRREAAEIRNLIISTLIKLDRNEEAQPHIETNRRFYQSHDREKTEWRFWETLSQWHARQGDFAKAYELVTRSHELHLAELETKNAGQLKKVQAVYELGKKDKEIFKLQQAQKDALIRELEEKSRRTVFGFMSVLFLVLCGFFFLKFRAASQFNKKMTLANNQLKRLNGKLNTISRTDALTGCLNRRAIAGDLDNEFSRFKRYGEQNGFSVILLDIDHFKAFNDTHGHDAGDFVLVETAKQIRTCIRDTDRFSRWGGEEFLILCPNTNLEKAVALAERIRIAIADHPFQLPKREAALQVTSSFGVSEICKGFTVEDLIKAADDALYESKGKGRNRVCKKLLQLHAATN